jgi:hypothetical protein
MRHTPCHCGNPVVKCGNGSIHAYVTRIHLSPGIGNTVASLWTNLYIGFWVQAMEQTNGRPS